MTERSIKLISFGLKMNNTVDSPIIHSRDMMNFLAALVDKGLIVRGGEMQAVQVAYSIGMGLSDSAKGGPKDKDTKKKKKKKTEKGDERRVTNAYMRWLQVNRERIKQELVSQQRDGGVGNIAKEAGIQWKALSAEEREPFQREYIAAKRKFKEAKLIVKEAGNGHRRHKKKKKASKKREEEYHSCDDSGQLSGYFEDDWENPYVTAENAHEYGLPCPASS